MSSPNPFPCAKTAAVLALHLDGDLAEPFAAAPEALGYGFVDNDSLHAHLRDCGSCQRALRRARRLDALLATTAGAAHGAHGQAPAAAWPQLQARWFAAAATDAAPLVAAPRAAVPVLAVARPVGPALAASVPPVVKRVGAWLAAAAALLVTALVLGLGRGPLATVEAAPAASAPLATAEGPRAPSPTAALPLRPAADALPHRHRRPNEPRRAEHQTLAAPVRELAAVVADSDRPAADRLAATRSLLTACRSFSPDPEGAMAALLVAMAAAGDFGTTPAVHQAQLGLLRDSVCARSLLTRHLVALDAPDQGLDRDGTAALVVATRLGGDANDALVRRVVRRHPDGAGFVAAALRCGVRPAGGARLLLDLWHDLANRGLAGDDPATARAWFGAQPAALFAELDQELASSRLSDRRQRCLLALGIAADDATLPTLLAHAGSRHHDEAHAAAFAIAGLPRTVLAKVVPLADDDEAGLLRAALARAEHPAAKPWVEALGLRPSERRLLREATLAQFPAVVVWFRARGAASD